MRQRLARLLRLWADRLDAPDEPYAFLDTAERQQALAQREANRIRLLGAYSTGIGRTVARSNVRLGESDE